MRTEPVDRDPTDLSRLLGVGAGAVAVLAAVAYSPTAGAVAALGLLAVVAGVAFGSHRAVSLGAAAALGGVLYAGVVGAPAPTLLAGVAATVVAWDLGGFSVDLGAQLGGEADTRRVEAVHALASVAVAVGSASLGYAVYLAATGGQPVAALVLLLVAGMLLAASLDYS